VSTPILVATNQWPSSALLRTLLARKSDLCAVYSFRAFLLVKNYWFVTLTRFTMRFCVCVCNLIWQEGIKRLQVYIALQTKLNLTK
jgi:hypothetical protein